MVSPYKVSRAAVRRFLLEAQLLSPKQSNHDSLTIKEETLQVIRQLECIQIDPVAAVERNQHLVLAARLPTYTPQALLDLLAEGELFEYMANAACLIPMADFPIFETARRRYQALLKPEKDKIQPVIEEVLHQLEAHGPLPSRAFSSTERVHGYWDNKQPKTKATSLALNLLLDTGEIRVVRREGNERFFALTTQAVSSEHLQQAKQMTDEEGYRAILEKYMRAYRVFDYKDPRFGWRRMKAAERKALLLSYVEQGKVIPLDIEGVDTPYFILAEDLERLKVHEEFKVEDYYDPAASPIRFLPPLDNLLWRRERIVDLFGFEYKWEIYTPAVKREYGYYTMPILAGDCLIGRIDPKLDREKQRLIIRLMQIEPHLTFSSKLEERIGEALASFARFHGVQEVMIELKKH